MIKAVIFDLDNTLYDFDAADLVARKYLCRYAEKTLGLDEETFLKIYAESRRIIKTRLTEGSGQHSRVLFFQTTLELLGKNPFDYILEMYEAYWTPFLEHMQLYDGVFEFLQRLKSAGIKTAVCTDMTAQIQFRKIRKLGLSHLIDALVSSEETGVEKPSPIMFRLALEKLNVRAEEAAMIGDSLAKDVKGAANVGMLPIYFVADRPIETAEFLTIKTYRDARLQSSIFENGVM